MHKWTALALVVVGGLAWARQDGARFVRGAGVQPLLANLAASGEKLPDPAVPREWEAWIRERDAEMRGRIERNVEDSISALIMLGTSFTTLPQLGPGMEAVTPAGDLTAAARGRVEAFLEALDRSDEERLGLILQFLRRRRITQEELRAYLCGNLRRAALERARVHSNGPPIPAAAMEAALRGLQDQGKAPAKIRRIAVVGPGLDPEYDPGAYNLFAALEAALHAGLAKAANIDLTVLDINPWVLSHVRAEAVRTGARLSARLSAQDLNVVTQTLEPGAFDLVVANSALAGYGRLDQALALVNIAQMLAPGGILLLSSGPLSMVPQELEPLGSGKSELAIYRRR